MMYVYCIHLFISFICIYLIIRLRGLERFQAVGHAAHARRAHHAHVAQAVADLRQHLPQLVQEAEAVARGAQAPQEALRLLAILTCKAFDAPDLP